MASCGENFGRGKFRHRQIPVPWGQLPEISAYPNSGGKIDAKPAKPGL
eukprot:CAMPEP_0174300732 /NCGR_PEP_ID=MMETSP0809-20121228/58636_1 /TAXON_ID=73025 ORGANISM="Eutreptiella gymnastica-like, Strain CCMP1594" /NCGR_SAMPLE_ID=MMETSP0809 /ASSEMBLY_ACC=CAM_ASM_000658 /LENGTH=47 /DNA_ID= /DNA_START= /DNA_END= /DNA_ORIENTATION=